MQGVVKSKRITKAVYTFHTAQYKGDVFNNKGSWLFPAVEFYTLALSLNYSWQFFDEVHLVTDEYGAEVVEMFSLPFTAIHCELDGLEDTDRFWALCKLHSYKKFADMGEPFVHIDSDAFITKPLDPRLANLPAFVQSSDPGIATGYANYFRKIVDHCPHEYPFDVLMSANDRQIQTGAWTRQSCMSILGVYDTDLVSEYAGRTLDLARHEFWDEDGFAKMNWFNVVIEQMHFAEHHFQKYGFEPFGLIQNWEMSNTKNAYGFHHVWGAKNSTTDEEELKRRKAAMWRITNWAFEVQPEICKRINNLFEKNCKSWQ